MNKPFLSLAPFAVNDENTKGRKEDEGNFPEEDMRSKFQHDRDRIIHSRAFRRLEAKTQVVLTHESDHSRTRLTHSLEVAQISESIAMHLGLNIYATQAIALGHDIGHTPFGHTGERALSTILEDFKMKGFKHNFQSLLVVNELEETYGKSCGLNLLYETRDGILKHSSFKGEKVNCNIKDYDKDIDISKDWAITLEGQIVCLVDEIAQRTHDTDDALRTNRISIDELFEQEIIKDVIKNSLERTKLNLMELKEEYHKNKKMMTSTLIISMIKNYVLQTITNTQKNIEKYNIKKYKDVLNAKQCIVSWDEEFEKKDTYFHKEFLKPRFYEHYEIKRMDSRAQYFLKQIFKAFHKHPEQLPELTHKQFIEKVEKDLRERLSYNGVELEEQSKKCKQECCYIPDSKNPSKKQRKKSSCPFFNKEKSACAGIRVIINHIAGMTDRYAHLEYSRLYFPPEISRM